MSKTDDQTIEQLRAESAWQSARVREAEAALSILEGKNGETLIRAAQRVMADARFAQVEIADLQAALTYAKESQRACVEIMERERVSLARRLNDAEALIRQLETPVARPIDQWNESHGPALWWWFPIEEPPYAGSPLDDDWPGYHTHWTPIVTPAPCDDTTGGAQ